MINNYIVYEINKNFNTNSSTTLEDCLFSLFELTKHPDIDKYKFSGYDNGLDRNGFFHLITKMVEM